MASPPLYGGEIWANLFIAGGQALNSKMQRMMEVVPEHIHDRSGIYLGSYDEIEKVKGFHK
jgi:fructose-1,6-bisphosphatase I